MTATSARAEIQCVGCGAAYSRDLWQRLPEVQTLGEVELRPYVATWSRGRSIEVRPCRKCGRKLARLGSERGAASLPEGEELHAERSREGPFTA